MAAAKASALKARAVEKQEITQTASTIAAAKAQAQLLAAKKVERVRQEMAAAQQAATAKANANDVDLKRAVELKVREEQALVDAEKARDAKLAEAVRVEAQAKKAASAASMELAVEGDKLKFIQQKNPKLVADIARAEQRMASVEKMTAKAKTYTQGLRNKNLEFRQVIEGAKGKLEMMKAKIERLQQNKAAVTGELISLRDSFAKSKKEAQVLRAKIKALKASNKNMQGLMKQEGQAAALTLEQRQAAEEATETFLTKTQLESKELKEGKELKKLEKQAAAQKKGEAAARKQAVSTKARL